MQSDLFGHWAKLAPQPDEAMRIFEEWTGKMGYPVVKVEQTGWADGKAPHGSIVLYRSI